MASDSPKVSNFLREQLGRGPGDSDPMHHQQFYFTEELLQDLWKKYQVAPFRFTQQVNQAVFVPAGAAHQVCVLSQHICMDDM